MKSGAVLIHFLGVIRQRLHATSGQHLHHQLRSRVKDQLTQERYADLEDVFVSLVEGQPAEAARRTRLSWVEG